MQDPRALVVGGKKGGGGGGGGEGVLGQIIQCTYIPCHAVLLSHTIKTHPHITKCIQSYACILHSATCIMEKGRCMYTSFCVFTSHFPCPV